MSCLLLSQVSNLTAEAAETENGALTEFIWVFLAVGLSVFVLLTTWRRVRRSQEHDKLTVEQRVSKVMPEDTVISGQINDLMAELADLSRQITGQIDTRMAKLDLLNAQADETIERLQCMLEKSPADAVPAELPTAAAKATSRNESPSREPNRAPIETEETRNILNWAGQGRTAVSIAQQLNRPVGEIELILALNKK